MYRCNQKKRNYIEVQKNSEILNKEDKELNFYLFLIRPPREHKTTNWCLSKTLKFSFNISECNFSPTYISKSKVTVTLAVLLGCLHSNHTTMFACFFVLLLLCLFPSLFDCFCACLLVFCFRYSISLLLYLVACLFSFASLLIASYYHVLFIL